MADNEGNKIVPFTGKKKQETMDSIPLIGVDEYGIPNIPIHVAYGVQLISRGKVIGVLLFTTQDKQNDAILKLQKAALKEKNHMTFRPESYPIY